jgi:hypothetical protein
LIATLPRGPSTVVIGIKIPEGVNPTSFKDKLANEVFEANKKIGALFLGTETQVKDIGGWNEFYRRQDELKKVAQELFLKYANEQFPHQAEVLADFYKFVEQRVSGRQGYVPFEKKYNEEVMSIILKATNNLKDPDISSLTNACSYLADRDQNKVFMSISNPESDGYRALREKIFKTLEEKTPNDISELRKYIWLYTLLDIKEPYLAKKFRGLKNAKHSGSSENVYLEYLPIPKAVEYIRKRLNKELSIGSTSKCNTSI